MQPNEFQALLEKYQRGTCTPEEERLVLEWYDNIGDGEQAAHEEPGEQVRARIWAAIEPQRMEKGRNRWLVRAAIVTIPLLACALLHFNTTSLSALVPGKPVAELRVDHAGQLHVNKGRRPLTIPLTDGSQVTLHPRSQLYVSEHFTGDIREVRLTGEAFFDVRRDPERPFVVYANDVVTRVLGTSFTVKAYEDDNEITVAVKTGKVSVFAGKNADSVIRSGRRYKEVILTPNQQIVYHRAIETVSKELVAEPQVIVPGSDLFRMHFENAPVSEILDALQRNYGVEIRYDSQRLSQCRLTTSMSDEGLYERIEVICRAIGATYALDEAVITISSDGC